MFEVGAPELLVIIIVAIVVIGPKDMPVALRTAGRWIGKIRRMSNHFRSGIETMIREAELEEMEKKWREHNRKVMEEHPAPEAEAKGAEAAALPPPAETPATGAEARNPPPDAAPGTGGEA